MATFRRRLPGPRLVFAALATALLAALAWWEPVTLVLAAPWLGALGWVVRRGGIRVLLPDEAFPSTAEAARRRLEVR